MEVLSRRTVNPTVKRDFASTRSVAAVMKITPFLYYTSAPPAAGSVDCLVRGIAAAAKRTIALCQR